MQKYSNLGRQHRKKFFLPFLTGITIVGAIVVIGLMGRMVYMNKKIQDYKFSIEQERAESKDLQIEMQEIEEELKSQESNVMTLEQELRLYKPVVIPQGMKEN